MADRANILGVCHGDWVYVRNHGGGGRWGVVVDMQGEETHMMGWLIVRYHEEPGPIKMADVFHETATVHEIRDRFRRAEMPIAPSKPGEPLRGGPAWEVCPFGESWSVAQ